MAQHISLYSTIHFGSCWKIQDKLKIQTIQKTQKKQNRKKRSKTNYVGFVASYDTRSGDKRWDYSTTLPASPAHTGPQYWCDVVEFSTAGTPCGLGCVIE